MTKIATVASQDLGSVLASDRVLPHFHLGRLFAPLALARVMAAIREYFRRQQVMFELSRLSDRELHEFGLGRDQIKDIFTPEFAARCATERRWRD